MTWDLTNRIKDTLAKETGTKLYPSGLRHSFAFLYPNSYSIGMSNLGLQILYSILNNRKDTFCERVFLPATELWEQYRKTRTPLMSIETQRVLADFEIIGVMMSFEMDYLNFLRMLKQSNIEPLAEQRGIKEPFIVIGGPCATFNPEPLAAFADAFIIGEGEETLAEFLDVFYEARSQGFSKEEVLLKVAQVKGVYVPRFYYPQYDENARFVGIQNDERVAAHVNRRWVKNLEAYPNSSAIITPDTEFENMFILEVARGCGRHCRFCMAGYCFRKPRARKLAALKKAIDERPLNAEKVGLMGAAVSDYPYIRELSAYLAELKIPFTVASLRADTLDEQLTRTLAASGQRTMTVAPEAGSKKMRAVINKGITEEDIYKTVQLAAHAGIKNLKLYYMIGLPGEEQEDIEEMVAMIFRIRTMMNENGLKGDLIISVNSFIPKPFTPFQWEAFAAPKVLKSRFKCLEQAFKKAKNIKLQYESVKESILQAVLARGDRQIAELLLAAVESEKTIKQVMLENGLNPETLATEPFIKGSALPWSHLDMGFTEQYLLKEEDNAVKQAFTPMCFDGCMRCGVCKED